MDYRDKFIVTITSYRDLKNAFSSQGFSRFVFYDLDSAKEFVIKSSEDAKRDILPLELKTTVKTTGIVIYGAPMVFGTRSQYARMRYFYNEKISISAEAIKNQQANIRQAEKRKKAQQEGLDSEAFSISKEAE